MSSACGRTAATLGWCCILLPGLAAANGAIDDPTWREANARTRGLLESFRAASGVPGLSVGIAVDGKIVLAEGLGIADLESGVPATADTRFRLGSTSKVLAAAATARLAQKQALDLDADIRRYIPSFPDKGATITARQLAGHLAGIRHYADEDFSGLPVDFRHFDSAESALAIFRDDPLRHAPGERYAYSTYGYTLLTAVIEGAVGRPYLNVLRDEVLQPIGMTQTIADDPRAIVPHRSGFYERNDGAIVHARYVDPSYKWAGGGMLSSAADLVRFGMAHTGAGFLDRVMFESVMTSQTTAAGESTGVGIGWRVGVDPAGRRIAHHEGSMGGCRSALLVYPGEGVVVAVLSNLTSTPLFALETAQVIAAPYLRDTNARASPGDAPEGVFDVDAELNGQQAPGTLTLRRGAPGDRGLLAVGPQRMQVFDVRLAERGWEMVLVHDVGGLLPAPLTTSGGVLEADLRFGNQRLRFTARPREP